MVPGSCSKIVEAVCALVVMLLWMFYVTGAVQTHCDGRKEEALCYGPLGGTVFIQLVDNSSEVLTYEMKHGTSNIHKVKNNEAVVGIHQSKYIFVKSNGTFGIRNLSTSDSGEYSLEMFDSDGRKKDQRTLQLSLEAPVESVQLDSECLSNGKVNVSCHSEGGVNPHYSWTLGENNLTESELLSVKETNTIVLRPNISGRLVCSVKTRVSSVFKEKYISVCEFVNCTSKGVHISRWEFKDHIQCDEPALDKYNIMEMLPIIAGTFGALLIFLVVGIGIFCFKKKKQNNKEEEEDDQKMTNAHRGSSQQELSMEPRVEYGKIKKKPPHYNTMAYGNMDNSVYGNIDECVYANV